jgi:putative flavoprotein involved in K+ transport
MQRVTTIVVGAGQCGLAMSRELSRRAIDHVVVERGRIGNSWRTERWDNLRLLTPNWLNGLFGHISGDPDGYMPAAEFTKNLASAAADISAPRRTGSLPHVASRGTVDRGCWVTASQRVPCIVPSTVGRHLP